VTARSWDLAHARAIWPGLVVAGVVALAATLLGMHYKASAMLFALLLGMALHFLAEEGRCIPGVQFASSLLLRTGVALLGLRITLDQVQELGLGAVALVVVAMAATLLAGIALSRALGMGSAFGTLTGGAVAICGASAALAIASILPRHANAERDAAFTVIGTTALSTVAMITYPIVCGALGLDSRSAGIFLGGTIHDVAQVVGAGYSMSHETGDSSTIVKLLRVAMLLPVCLAIGVALHVRGSTAAHAAPLLPGFAVAFALLVLVNSAGLIPAAVTEAGSTFSRACLITAIAAIGMKTSLRSLVDMGLKPVFLLVSETLLLAAIVLGVIVWA
jgi:uncharacterized integral membrane protein (TIGR00698 family)